MMFNVLGMPQDHPDMVTARSALEKLVAQNGEEAFCQPCLSPVWDTVLAAHALLEASPDETAKPSGRSTGCCRSRCST